MGVCVVLQPDGTLLPTGQPASECAGYVLVTGSEHGVYALVQQALGMPEPEVVGGWFVGSFGAVMLFYMSAYFVGRIVSMFDTDNG